MRFDLIMLCDNKMKYGDVRITACRICCLTFCAKFHINCFSRSDVVDRSSKVVCGLASVRLNCNNSVAIAVFVINDKRSSFSRFGYDNSIVAYKTGTEQNINLVLSTIRAAKRKEKVTAELQLHSDQGFQYTSQAYFKLTQSYHITPSMSRRGNPYDNALGENFFSILKTECIYRAKIRTYEEARLLIGAYIQFYNNERIQLKTKLTPLEKRCQFVA